MSTHYSWMPTLLVVSCVDGLRIHADPDGAVRAIGGASGGRVGLCDAGLRHRFTHCCAGRQSHGLTGGEPCAAGGHSRRHTAHGQDGRRCRTSATGAGSAVTEEVGGRPGSVSGRRFQPRFLLPNPADRCASPAGRAAARRRSASRRESCGCRIRPELLAARSRSSRNFSWPSL